LTKKPEFDFGGSASFTYGNFDAVRLRGEVTGPISDKLAFRLGGSYNRRDGYADNLATGGDFSDRNRWGIQGQLLFEPSDDLSIRLIGDYDEIDESCCFATNIIAGATTAFVIPALGGEVVLEDPFSFEAFADAEPINRIENGGLSLHIQKGVADLAEFTSITSYRESDTFQLTDGDSSSADITTSLNELNTETFTQEIRLTSKSDDSPVDWLVGAFYFNEDLNFPGEFEFGEDFRPFLDIASGGNIATAEAFLGLPVGETFSQAGQGTFEERGQENRTWSLFATVDWHITDALTATGGISYINDEKDAFLTQVNTDAFSSLELGGTPLAGLQALQFFPPFLNFPNEVEDGQSRDDEVTYTARLAYDATSWLNVYGSYSTGFKASAINLSNASRPSAEDLPLIQAAGLEVPNLTTGSRLAGPEETEVFEIGAKLQLSNLFVALTLFDQAVEGFQSNTFDGLGFSLANAGQQSTRGIEVDSNWAVTQDLTLSFFGAFYDAEFDDFADSPFGDLTGTRPAGIPAVSTNLSANYNFTLVGLDGFIRGDWQYTSSTEFSDNPAVQALIGFERESNLVNLSAGVTLPIGTQLTVWGRNIADEQFIAGAFPAVGAPGSITGFPNQPATYGFTLRQTF